MEIAEIMNSAPFVYGNLAFFLTGAMLALLLVTRLAKLNSRSEKLLNPLFVSAKER
jgi:hypothetical protein